MALIRFRDWLKNEDDFGQTPQNDPSVPDSTMSQIQQLERQLADPATPPETKQTIQNQLQQLRGGQRMASNPMGQQAPRNMAPGQNNAPPPMGGFQSQTPNQTPNQGAPYKWVNGKPVSNMNQV